MRKYLHNTTILTYLPIFNLWLQWMLPVKSKLFKWQSGNNSHEGNHAGFHVKWPLLLSNFNKTPQYQISLNSIQPFLIYAGRQTYRHTNRTNLISALLQLLSMCLKFMGNLYYLKSDFVPLKDSWCKHQVAFHSLFSIVTYLTWLLH